MTSKMSQLLSPPGWPLVLIGGSAGLLAGTFSLSESVDKATAVGLALFFGITIGGWLGGAVVKAINYPLIRMYKRADHNLEKSKNALKHRFALAISSLDTEKEEAVQEWPQSRDVEAQFGSSLELHRRISRFCWYLYPIAGIIVFSESMTMVLLSVGGLEVPAAVSLITLAGRVLFSVLFVAYLLSVLSGLYMMARALRFINAINSMEQLLAARRDGDIEKLVPDTSSIEKAVSVPPLLVSRLAA